MTEGCGEWFCLANLPGDAFSLWGNFFEAKKQMMADAKFAGLSRAKAEGKSLGRPKSLTDEEAQEVLRRLAAGEAVASIARAMGTSRQTVMRIRRCNLEAI